MRRLDTWSLTGGKPSLFLKSMTTFPANHKAVRNLEATFRTSL